LYVIGGFNQVDGEARPGLAALDAVTGALQPWNPNVSRVNAIAASGDVVYLAGDFSTVNGVARRSLAAVDAHTGELLPWQPTFQLSSLDGALLSDGQVVYVGGVNGAAAFDAHSGERLPWNPEFGYAVTRFAFGPSVLAVAGQFFNVGSIPQQGLALFERTAQ
jgi:outer membrane protein assembly factor BamB